MIADRWHQEALPASRQGQAGLDYSNPLEGDAATTYFHACPNNDGGSSLPLNARIKIVVKDSGGAPIPGISPADLFILFNGGTPAQGFSGEGPDSVIANSSFNQNPLCPDVRYVPADSPTDADGVAYIPFTGPGGIRDPNRKWGHFDSELPVYVLGIKISGRLTSGSENGSYVLQIKNFDHTGGLGTALNQGEAVTSADFNAFVLSFPPAPPTLFSFWRDFDSVSGICLPDYNMISHHVAHDCDTPLNP